MQTDNSTDEESVTSEDEKDADDSGNKSSLKEASVEQLHDAS